MKIYYCTNFKGHYPVGTSALLVARNKEHARRLLENELDPNLRAKNDPGDWEFTQVDMHVSKCIILQDGDY